MRLRIVDLDLDDDVIDEPTFEPMKKRRSFDDDTRNERHERKRSPRIEMREVEVS
jgi:hypothetical protein